MARYEKIGAFGLTEPDVGSGASRDLTTTARRDGDSWVLTGQKEMDRQRHLRRSHRHLGWYEVGGHTERLSGRGDGY